MDDVLLYFRKYQKLNTITTGKDIILRLEDSNTTYFMPWHIRSTGKVIKNDTRRRLVFKFSFMVQ